MKRVTCWFCEKEFDRGYSISKSRAAKPQYCCIECRVGAAKKSASGNLVARFFARVERRGENDCWPWTGRLDENGYGVFDVDNRPNIASRVSLEIHLGKKLPAHIFACHHCDNPPCVNPEHLFPGTQQQNMKDAGRKGRVGGNHGRLGTCINTSKLNEEKVIEIKRSQDPAKLIAEKYGVSATAIRLIRNGKNWGWLNA
jgi:hypothetical protein